MASADRQRLLRSPQLLGVPAAPQRSRPRLGSRFLSSISTLNNCILLVVVVTGFGRSTRDVPLVAITTGRDAREIFRVYPHVYRLLTVNSSQSHSNSGGAEYGYIEPTICNKGDR